MSGKIPPTVPDLVDFDPEFVVGDDYQSMTSATNDFFHKSEPDPVDVAFDDLRKKLKQCLEDARELGTIRATLVINWGKGYARQNTFEVEHEGKSTTMVLIEILERLTKINENLRAQVGKKKP